MEFGFDGTSGKIDSLNHQMQFILSRLDAMNVGADYGSTSSKRTVTDKGKGVAKSTSKESMKGIEEEGGIHKEEFTHLETKKFPYSIGGCKNLRCQYLKAKRTRTLMVGCTRLSDIL